MKYTFGDIVIVDGNLIGVIVKCWGRAIAGPNVGNDEPKYEVYVRSWNGITEYKESEVERYLVRHKELDEQELEWQANATRA
jgi:hypothetical protein